MRVSFPLSGTGAIWQRLSLESCHCLEVGRDKKLYARTYTQIHLADRVVLCWHGSPHCDLNLFCLEYECPLGSWCASREQTDRMCEHYVHVGLSICGRKTERERDSKRRVKDWDKQKEARRKSVCAGVHVARMCLWVRDSQVSRGHVHRFK